MSVHVVSMCKSDHALVWERTSVLQRRFMQADEFIVYVPEGDIPQFRSISAPGTRVRAQESLGSRYREKLSKAVASQGQANRVGWYLQQYYKLEALEREQADSVVIWDADCVPVAPQTLFDDRGQPVYMRASEFHPEYFRMIERLTGQTRQQDFSFVIPGFPLRKEWLEDFFAEIERRQGKDHWSEALIQASDFSQVGAFSETETLGTWITNKYPNSWSTIDIAWERYGRSRFGPAKKFAPDDLIRLGQKHHLGIISFENWDRRTIHWWARRVKRSARDALSSVRRDNSFIFNRAAYCM